MYMQMGGWCLTTSGAKELVYMVAWGWGILRKLGIFWFC